MSWLEDAERTIPGTPRRRMDARRQGRVPYSPDLHTALMWGAMALILIWQGPSLIAACGRCMWRSLAIDPGLSVQDLTTLRLLDRPLLMSGFGLLVTMWIMGIALRWLQTGPMWAPELAQPRADRVNPFQGIGRIVSSASCLRGGFWFLRLAVTGGLIVGLLYAEAHTLAELPGQSSGRISLVLGEFLISFAFRMGGALLGLAAIDFGWQWWQHERSLRMTHEDWRSEQREADQKRTASPPARSIPRRQ